MAAATVVDTLQVVESAIRTSPTLGALGNGRLIGAKRKIILRDAQRPCRCALVLRKRARGISLKNKQLFPR